MTSAWPRGLLVSVRDPEEAAIAVAAGAAIVDVKEPRNGPLGRPESPIVAAVAAVTGRHAPLTLAAGELAAADEIPAHLLDVLRLLPPGVPPPLAVKAGPAGLTRVGWRTAFERLRGRLPAGIDAVAVAYADWRRARAPHPDDVLAEAIAAGARAMLIDTFDKQGPGLFATAPRRVVGGWIRAADAAGLTLAVAGRLTPADVAEAFNLGAGIVGVRSAACEGGRDGRIAAPRVQPLVRLVDTRAAGKLPRASGVHVS